MRVAFVLRFTEALPGYQICSFLLGIAAFPGSYFDVYCRLVWLFCSWFFFFLLAFIPPRLPMPPCVVRPVGPPARAGEHSKPSCLQARAVRARRTDVLGVGVLGGCPAPSARRVASGQGRSPAIRTGEVATRLLFHLVLWSLLWARQLDAGARPPSIHPSIHSGLPLIHSSPPPPFPCQSLIYSCPSPCRAWHASIFVMYAHRPCAVRWRSPCDTRFAPPHQSRPVRRLQWSAMPHAGGWGGACAGGRGAMMVGARWAGRGDWQQKLH